jgi:hypothetical protein
METVDTEVEGKMVPRKAETPCVGSLRNRMGRANVVVRIIDAARR